MNSPAAKNERKRNVEQNYNVEIAHIIAPNTKFLTEKYATRIKDWNSGFVLGKLGL